MLRFENASLKGLTRTRLQTKPSIQLNKMRNTDLPTHRAKLDGAKLTVVILTLNEVSRLPTCLAAIPDRYPVMVLDSGSSDGTYDLARQLGCQVVQNAWPGFSSQRNYALEKCGIESTWVLFVDADEVYPREFFENFDNKLSQSVDFDVGEIASVLVFRGKTLTYAPGYPIYHPRLVRRGSVRFTPNQLGHGETVDAGARTKMIDIPYLHYSFDGDIVKWMSKHVNLAKQEAYLKAPRNAHLTSRATLSLVFQNAFSRTIGRFLYHYIWRGGYRDGREGLAYVLMYCWYEITKGIIRFVEKV